MQKNPIFSKDGWYFLSRTEKYVRGIRVMPVCMRASFRPFTKPQAIRDMVFEEGLSRDEGEFLYRMFDANTAIDLHFAMFLPTILGQGDREQVCLVMMLIGVLKFRPSVCLSLCLSVCLCVCLSLCMPVSVSVSVSVYVSVSVSVCSFHFLTLCR
jgi:hypothetical protein